MRSRKLIRKVAQPPVVKHGAVLLGAKVILLVAVFCLVGQPALAKGPKNCSKQAKAAFKACKSEVKDDYFIAVGNCYNLPTNAEIKECIQDAKEEKEEAKEECEDQLDGRIELFCEVLGQDPYNPVIDPANFVDPATITNGAGNVNPYFPLAVGNVWEYQGAGETITVTVTANTVEILGVTCREVTDVVEVGGEVIEDTKDWYAQDTDGNVWYFGEFSVEREECDEESGELCEGLYGDDGSWQAGFEGAKPGIIMFADPSAEVGTVFRQEFALGDAEDGGEVISFDDVSVTVTYGTFDTDVLQTWDFTPIEPDVGEYKYYAPNVGLIKEEAFEEGIATGEVVELTNFTAGP